MTRRATACWRARSVQSIKVGDRTLESAGGTDAFVAKLDKTGKVLWAERYGGKGDEAITGLAVDREGNVVIGGKAQGDVDLGGQALKPQLRGPQQRSLFVAKLNASGKSLWVRELARGQRLGGRRCGGVPGGKDRNRRRPDRSAHRAGQAHRVPG